MAMARWEGEYSDQLLEIIDWCLHLNHLERPQSAFSLQKALTAQVQKPKQLSKQGWLERMITGVKDKAKPS